MKKLILLAIAMCLVFAWGCSKKVQTEPEVVVVEEKEVIVAEVVVDPMQVYKAEYDALPVSHTVTKGECLWWISEYKHVYNDPFVDSGYMPSRASYDIPRYYPKSRETEWR